jgi:membrane associated rhomboid family serine protease
VALVSDIMSSSKPATKQISNEIATQSIERISDQVEETWDQISDSVEFQWDKLCDYIEENGGDLGKWISMHFLRRLTVEAPVVICFSMICVIIHLLNITLIPNLNRFLAVHDTFSILNPMQYIRLFTHVVAHDKQINHIKGNLMNLLLVGPSAEHVYGSQAMLLTFLLVALVSAVAHILVGGEYTHQLGASGIVFCVILLNSLVAADSGTIPLSFLLTAGLWVTDEVIKFVWNTDHMSHHAHLTGAIVGTAAGYYFKGKSAFEANKARSINNITSGTTNPFLRTAALWKSAQAAKTKKQ